MKAPVAGLVLRLVALLPFRGARAVGAAVGWLLWRLPNRTRRQSRANIEQAYADRDPGWRRRLLRSSLIEAGRTLAESAWFWHRNPDRLAELMTEARGTEHVWQARRRGEPIIFATPHIGAWELAAACAARLMPLTVLYRPPRLAALAEPLLRSRRRLGMKPVPTDTNGVRALHRALQRGEAVGLLPDQTPRNGQGVFAPFMGRPALTMTLLPRIARRTGAHVLFAVMLRRPHGRGFAVHIWPAGAGIADPDPVVAATAVNRELERAIALAPAQYMWSYRRFRRRPPEGADEATARLPGESVP